MDKCDEAILARSTSSATCWMGSGAGSHIVCPQDRGSRGVLTRRLFDGPRHIRVERVLGGTHGFVFVERPPERVPERHRVADEDAECILSPAIGEREQKFAIEPRERKWVNQVEPKDRAVGLERIDRRHRRGRVESSILLALPIGRSIAPCRQRLKHPPTTVSHGRCHAMRSSPTPGEYW